MPTIEVNILCFNISHLGSRNKYRYCVDVFGIDDEDKDFAFIRFGCLYRLDDKIIIVTNMYSKGYTYSSIESIRSDIQCLIVDNKKSYYKISDDARKIDIRSDDILNKTLPTYRLLDGVFIPCSYYLQ